MTCGRAEGKSGLLDLSGREGLFKGKLRCEQTMERL